MTIKLRQQGNSKILTVPKTIQTSNDTEYNVTQDEQGRIIYEPADNEYDMWKDPQYDNLDYDEILKNEYKDLGYNPRNLKPVGHEVPRND